MERYGYVEREAADRTNPGRMRPGYAALRGTCPCGSGLTNADCHRVSEVDYLAPASERGRRPQLTTHGHPLVSDAGEYSSGVATRCHSCGAVLTVGVGFGGEDVVLVCECGGRNAAPRIRVSATD